MNDCSSLLEDFFKLGVYVFSVISMNDVFWSDGATHIFVVDSMVQALECLGSVLAILLNLIILSESIKKM